MLEGLRAGRIFAVAGDLISELNVEVKAGDRRASVGETLQAAKRQPITLTIQFRDPDATNAHGDNPRVARVDVIVGDVRGKPEDSTVDKNPTTHVVARFTEKEWTQKGGLTTITNILPSSEADTYVRLRGTSTQDLEPPMDTRGESPWSDLWFYSNPIFIERR